MLCLFSTCNHSSTLFCWLIYMNCHNFVAHWILPSQSVLVMVLKYLQSFKTILRLLMQIIPLVYWAQQSQLVAGYLQTLSKRTVCAGMEQGIFRTALTSREDIKCNIPKLNTLIIQDAGKLHAQTLWGDKVDHNTGLLWRNYMSEMHPCSATDCRTGFDQGWKSMKTTEVFSKKLYFIPI